jgi:hypothetical protein
MALCCPVTPRRLRRQRPTREWFAHCNRQEQSKEIEMYERLHNVICNVSVFILPGVGLQIKFRKARNSFYLMNIDADSKTIFKFLDAKFCQTHKANPRILLVHNEILKTKLVFYNLKRVELKFFTFSSRHRSPSIDNAVICRIPKLLLFTMLANKDFLAVMETNPYKFQLFDFPTFVM